MSGDPDRPDWEKENAQRAAITAADAMAATHEFAEHLAQLDGELEHLGLNPTPAGLIMAAGPISHLYRLVYSNYDVADYMVYEFDNDDVAVAWAMKSTNLDGAKVDQVLRHQPPHEVVYDRLDHELAQFEAGQQEET